MQSSAPARLLPGYRRRSLAAFIGVCVFLCALFGSPTVLHCQSTTQPPLGIAWNVVGVWHQGAGTDPVRTGAAIPPGALLLPEPSESDHSITILLPDGQRVLYECFTTRDCARGFRVPQLDRRPGAFAADMLARVRAVLERSNQNRRLHSEADSDLAQDEAVVLLGQGGKIELTGISASLPNGRYTYSVRSLAQGEARQVRRAVEKASESIRLIVPGAGTYEVVISDSQQKPRIDLRVAAVTSSLSTNIQRSFERAHNVFMDWNEDYQGWPVHEFQCAFLTSLMLRINPETASQSNAKGARLFGVTREPQFLSSPGRFQE